MTEVIEAVVIDDATTEPWQPMQQGPINPEALRVSTSVGDPFDEAWHNNVYDCQVRYLDPARGKAGSLHVSLKRRDRMPIRDWRHLQSIKNEVCGWGREALELFPAEGRLVDGANQTHLWVTPAGQSIELGWLERTVATEEEMVAELAQRGIPQGKARQRSWQRGLSTGPSYRP